MSLLTKAIKLAVTAHEGQMSKDGQPYIFHPLTVMMDPAMTTEALRSIAILHDVIEDTHIGEEELRMGGMPGMIIDAVVAMTKFKRQSYNEYLQQVMGNELAHMVKMADVRHNSCEARLCKLSKSEQDYLREKYKKAKIILGMESE